MPRNGSSKKRGTQGLYDRIAEVQNLAMKINGYRASVAKYLKSLDLEIGPEATVLDAGCGTGLVTVALHEAGYRPRMTVALDLSHNSLKVAREEAAQRKRRAKHVVVVQGNVLSLPFPDDSIDLALTCGVLEYTPLDAGLSELARVLKKGARLVFIPVKPSIVGSVLELLYNFKTHSLKSMRQAAARHFNIVGNDNCPITEPLSWSKTIFLLEKK